MVQPFCNGFARGTKQTILFLPTWQVDFQPRSYDSKSSPMIIEWKIVRFHSPDLSLSVLLALSVACAVTRIGSMEEEEKVPPVVNPPSAEAHFLGDL